MYPIILKDLLTLSSMAEMCPSAGVRFPAVQDMTSRDEKAFNTRQLDGSKVLFPQQTSWLVIVRKTQVLAN